MLKIDNTRRSSLVTCARKTFLTFKQHLSPVYGSTALRYGSVWHEVMDSYHSYIRENGWKAQPRAMQLAILAGKLEWDHYTNSKENGLFFRNDYRTLEALIKSFLLYLERFNYDQSAMEIIESESPFEITIVPDEEEMELYPNLKPFLFTGIIDLEVVLNGLPWVIDHKTTGQALTTQVIRTKRSPQFIGYTFAAKHWLSTPPEGALITFHHLSAYKSKTTQQYGDPKIDFQRTPQIYSDSDLVNWRNSLLSTVSRWIQCEDTGNWPMEFDSCYQFGECKFCPLCEQQRPLHDLITEGFYVAPEWEVAQAHSDKLERRKKALDALAQGGMNGN